MFYFNEEVELFNLNKLFINVNIIKNMFIFLNDFLKSYVDRHFNLF